MRLPSAVDPSEQLLDDAREQWPKILWIQAEPDALPAELRRGRFDPRSTPEGLPISKDVWMLGAGLALLIDGATADD